MGSATREALDAGRADVGGVSGRIELQTAEDLFSVAQTLGSSAQLRGPLGNAAAGASARSALARAVFAGQVSDAALELVVDAVERRWSSAADLTLGIEDLGIRVAAVSADSPEQIGRELFVVGEAVTSDSGLELALRSRLVDRSRKAALVDQLLGRDAAPQTVAIVRQLVLQPADRTIREGLRHASDLVADQAGESIAIVTSAVPLSDDQRDRLGRTLTAQYGRTYAVNVVVDPSILGGLRVRVGDDVIDGSVSSRLADARRRLAS